MSGSRVTVWSARHEGAPADLRLAGRLYVSAEPDPEWRAGSSGLPGLVVGHGAGSNSLRHEAFCLEAERQGFAVLAIDFRGHGDSEGEADGPLELDILAAVDFLRGHSAVDPRRICYRGSSMGGFYGLKAATKAGLAAAALLCPASEIELSALLSKLDDTPPSADTEAPAPSTHDTDVVTRWSAQAFRDYFRSQDSAGIAAKVTCPILLIHARGDDQVPFSRSVTIAERLTTETLLLALSGGSHTSAQHDPEVSAFTVRWLMGIGERMERSTGFEPATFGLGSRRSAN